MPQDPNLYGQPPPKRQRKAMDLSSSLSFSAQLGSLLSKPPTASSSSSTPAPATATKGRTRPSKTDDIFAGVKAKRKDGAKRDFDAPDGRRGGGNKLRLRSPTGTFESEREREAARLNMEEKARRYAAMKRGDYVPDARAGPGTGDRDPLVDFDRKWAEKHLDKPPGGGGGSSSADSSDDDDDDGNADGNDTEVITYTDEFGRTRRGTRAQARRQEQRARAGLAAAADLEAMSARPVAPASGLIWGDAVQAEAFAAADEEGMEALARKRDRSATPPPETHYDAAREIRTRGTGFYAFTAGDEARRKEEMEALEAARAETERVRREREERARGRRDEVERRRREIEERRRDVAERRAKKLADSFLDGLGADLGGGLAEAGAEAVAADTPSAGPDAAGAAAPDENLSPRARTEGEAPSRDPAGQQQAEEAPR